MRWRSSSESPLSMTKGFMPWPGTPGGEHPPARGPRHVRVLALGVDDVGGYAAAQAPEHPQLGGETLAAAGAGEDGGVRVEMGAVPGVVDHRGAGPHVDAVEGAPAGVQVGRREGEEPGDAGRVQAAPLRHGVQGQGQGREQPLALPEGQVVQLAEGRGEVGLGPLGHLLEGRLVLGVEGDGQGRVEEPLAARAAPRRGAGSRPPGRSPPPVTWCGRA